MKMKTYEEYFKDFSGRDERLRNVIRYRSYPTMFYRTNLAMHSKRVVWQTMALLNMFPADVQATLDEEKIILTAWVHDDHEIIMGDRQSASDWHMTTNQFSELYQKEVAAVDEVCKLFPETIGTYAYRDILHEAVQVETLASQIVKLADKIEGSGEALHELFAGNTVFSQRMIDPDYHKENAHPEEYYGQYFDALWDKLPLLSPFSSFLTPPLVSATAPYAFAKTSAARSPHTRASLDIPTGYAPYDYWKRNILSRATPDEIRQLYVTVE